MNISKLLDALYQFETDVQFPDSEHTLINKFLQVYAARNPYLLASYYKIILILHALYFLPHSRVSGVISDTG